MWALARAVITVPERSDTNFSNMRRHVSHFDREKARTNAG